MSVASKILKNFSLFVNGRGYAGVADEVKLPNLSIKGEDFRAGGMDAPVFVEMGQEKLEASFTLSSYDPNVLNNWGIGEGTTVPFVVRGALESLDGSVSSIKVSLNGTVRTMEFGSLKAGDKSTVQFTVDLRNYEYVQDGASIIKIDVPNFVRIINGVDRLAAQRAALGI